MATAASTTSALLPVYSPRGVTFVSGEGCHLTGDDGRSYLDLTAGIGVNALGYGHPAVIGAVQTAAARGVFHTSNLFRTAPAEELATELVASSFGDRVFFCNSGTESTEAALKFARRAAGSPEQTEFVAVRGSFHGRTMGALSVTDRPDYQQPFAPLVPGVTFVDRDAADGQLETAIVKGRTAGVIVEPVQGEGGVYPLSAAFLKRLRKHCDEAGAVLIFDEVQCGLGRTGSLFACEAAGVTPDILTLAKPLASGLPMGAVIVTERIAKALKRGDHASTFGGGPLVASVALATLNVIRQPSFLDRVRQLGRKVGKRLDQIAQRQDSVSMVRGRGLMWGIELWEPAGPVTDRAFEDGVLLLTAGPRVVRMLPPLVISDEELEEGLAAFERALP